MYKKSMHQINKHDFIKYTGQISLQVSLYFRKSYYYVRNNYNSIISN